MAYSYSDDQIEILCCKDPGGRWFEIRVDLILSNPDTSAKRDQKLVVRLRVLPVDNHVV